MTTARRFLAVLAVLSVLALGAVTPAAAAPGPAGATASSFGGPQPAVTLAALQPRPTASSSIESFLRAAYADFLGRPPSTAELVARGPALQSGAADRSAVTMDLSRSDEWLTYVVSGFYQSALGRGPDPSGLAHWIALARGGMPVADIAASFYASQEYFQTVGASDVETWVRALYRALLLRDGDPGGVADWARIVRSGVPRDRATIGFYQSEETVRLRIQTLYQRLLGRGADPSGLDSWPAVVRSQGDLVLAASLASSPEYLIRSVGRFPRAAATAPWVEVVGTGTPASCTTAALLAAVRDGGVVEFRCGAAPITITLTETLYTCNTTTCQHPWINGAASPGLVLDGGGLVTLSGGGARGIFYANACEDDFGWLNSRCDIDTRPRVVMRGLTFADGNAQGPPPGRADIGGGGAIAMRSGTLVVEDVVFRNNRTVAAHPDWGGGAIRLMGMVATATITGSTFEGNRGANGGAVSSLLAPVVISGSTFTGNVATGTGASSGQGGNGGAVYFDGNHQEVRVEDSTLSGNVAPEGGSGIFYVSNNRSGLLTIDRSSVVGNTGERFWTSPYRDVFYLGRTALPTVILSTVN